MAHSSIFLIIPISIAYLLIVYLLLTVAQRSSRVPRPRQ